MKANQITTGGHQCHSKTTCTTHTHFCMFHFFAATFFQVPDPLMSFLQKTFRVQFLSEHFQATGSCSKMVSSILTSPCISLRYLKSGNTDTLMYTAANCHCVMALALSLVVELWFCVLFFLNLFFFLRLCNFKEMLQHTINCYLVDK